MSDDYQRWAEWYRQHRVKELTTGPAAGMLLLLESEPTLLDEAPADFGPEDIDQRRLHEEHPCLRCGKPAEVAYVNCLDTGNRWLDLCAACDSWMRKAMS